jgi:tRNA(Ile)-lysidine synthase
VVGNLARTATQLAADNAALDGIAAAVLEGARAGDPSAAGLAVTALAGLAPAIRTRALHLWARQLGTPGAALSHRHVAALDALVTSWHGQGPTRLPGDIAVARRAGVLLRVDERDV